MNTHGACATPVASDEGSVRSLYQDDKVAGKYLAERFRFSWWRQLHRCQVAAVNRTIAERGAQDVLEVAPGPARLSTEVTGMRRGTLVEASPQMIAVARRRLESAGLTHLWDLREGNAFDLSGLGREFDLVYTFRFIRHFQEPERARFYEQVHRRLRPGGLFLYDAVGKHVRDAQERSVGGRRNGLKVYDVTYASVDELAAEMRRHGFELDGAESVLNHFRFQSWLSHKLDDVAPRMVERAIHLLDHVASDHPLEWICRFRKV
ncbi:MAG: class I SAM-dependent methyltransferase [Nitrospirae bacterium]|nr:class I SAM-dependent methyltransferase [Nitrospirota bacterium]